MSIEMVGVKEASELTGLKPATIRKYAREKKIPHYRFGGGTVARYRFLPEEIHNWLRSHRVMMNGNIKHDTP